MATPLLLRFPWLSVLVILCMLDCIQSDLASDRAECTNQLVGLATCLPYVQADAKAPTPDCCSGFGQVVAKSLKCLCVLIKDRDDPQLGLHINVTKALTLPLTCSVPTNVSDCPKLLNLPENSADAKVFYQFANTLRGTPSNGNAKANSSTPVQASMPSSDARRKRWSSPENLGGVWLWSVLTLANLLVSLGPNMYVK